MMKKALYIILLSVEAAADLLMLGLIYSNIGWFACVIILAIVAALLIALIGRFRNTQDAAIRKKLLRHIALVMFIPAAVGMLLAIYVIVSLMLYFG